MLKNVWKHSAGRIRAIAFHCQRCNTIKFEIITPEMVKHSEDNLHEYNPPKGWGRHQYGLLCDKCNKEYKEFMERGNEWR